MIKKVRKKTGKFLRWSQKYTKTDMIYLTKGGFWMTVGQIISATSGILVAIAFANLIDPEIYGTYKYVNSFIEIFSIFTLGGMNTALTRAIARGFDGTTDKIIKERFKWGSLAGLAGLATAGYYFFNNNLELAISFLIIAFFVPFLRPLDSWSAIMIGKKKFKKLNQYKALSLSLQLVILLSTLLLTDNLFFIITANIGSMTLAKFIIFKLATKKNIKNNQEDPQALSYGRHLSFMGIIGPIANKLDDILMFHYLGALELAIYSFAKVPVDKFTSIFQNAKSLIFPKIAQKEINSKIKKGIYSKMLKFLLFLAPCLVLFLLILPHFFQLLLPKYIESIKYAQILSLRIIFLPVILMSNSILAHANKKTLYIQKTVLPLCKIILLFSLLPVYGIWGAVIAILSARFINFFLNLILFIKLKSVYEK